MRRPESRWALRCRRGGNSPNEAVAVGRCQIEAIDLLERHDLGEGCFGERCLPFKCMQTNTFEKITEGQVTILGQTLQDLHQALLQAHASLHPRNLEGPGIVDPARCLAHVGMLPWYHDPARLSSGRLPLAPSLLTADRVLHTLPPPTDRRMPSNSTSRPSQSILWIAVIVLALVALGNQMRLTTCIGDCCQAELSSCCDADESLSADTGQLASCDCCDQHGDATGDRSPAEGAPGSISRTCAPDCCLAVTFDVDMAPIATPVRLPTLAVATFTPALPACLSTPVREVVRTRPFDRGPPRIDRCTAMRACIVLLI